MSEFNRLTIVAAVEVIDATKPLNNVKLLAIEWNIESLCKSDTKSGYIADLAKVVANEDIKVSSLTGEISLARAVVLQALASYNQNIEEKHCWIKLKAGLRQDGYEIDYSGEKKRELFGGGCTQDKEKASLVPMFPNNAPELKLPEAKDEILSLLEKYSFLVSKGHLEHAIKLFSNGDWAPANAQFRTFYESYLNEIAVKLGCDENYDSNVKRQYLEKNEISFILSKYNEKNYIDGLMKRMHPEGSHPGLSEEEDATFRLQITLITARLFLRRFDKRMSSENG